MHILFLAMFFSEQQNDAQDPQKHIRTHLGICVANFAGYTCRYTYAFGGCSMDAGRLSSMVSHYHYHAYAAPPSPSRQPTPPPAPRVVRVRDMGVQTDAPPDVQAAPRVAPSTPPAPAPPRPDGFVAGKFYDLKRKWIAIWATIRPAVVWIGQMALIALDFVLTRVSIGFLFRPVGGA